VNRVVGKCYLKCVSVVWLKQVLLNTRDNCNSVFSGLY
jgi:hypothetical protein